MISTIFNQLQLLVIHNQRLDFYLRDLNRWFFGGVPDLIIVEIVLTVANLIVRERQKYSEFRKIFTFRLICLHTFMHDSRSQRAQYKIPHL